MNGTTKAAVSRRTRVFKVAPMPHAVRALLAISAGAAFAGPVLAGAPCEWSATQPLACSVQQGQMAEKQLPVVDLTAVDSQGIPSAVVASPLNGIEAKAAAFTVNINNNGPITRSGSGNVIGINADFPGADVKINNRAAGVIDVQSNDGLADGIFAYGQNVTVTNAGGIRANGFDWAAGIEAESYDLTTVTNNGDISATATANDEANGIYGNAFGIYASGGARGVRVTNNGEIAADGVFATGVLAQGSGPITISNTGDITVGGNNSSKYHSTYYATGIAASSNFENSAIRVDNSGNIEANGYFGSTGITAVASGYGSSVRVTNSGAIGAISDEPNYSNSIGVIASGDAGAEVRNNGGGSIHASGNYTAYGVQALTFNGDANVVNHGDVQASASGGSKYSATAIGVLASSLNGAATVTNTGSIAADAYGQGFAGSTGIYAGGVDASVVNRGTIAVDGGTATGITAQTTTGDVKVVNDGSIEATGKYGWGVRGFSTYGDVHLSNGEDGSIVAEGQIDAGGLRGVSRYGDVQVVNAGSIDVANGFGMYGASTDGDVSMINSGTVVAIDGSGIETYLLGEGTITVVNSGHIESSESFGGAWGIDMLSEYGDLAAHNSGTIDAYSEEFSATGIYGGDAFAGADGYSIGNASIDIVNRGGITVSSGSAGSRATARGIFAAGDDVNVINRDDGSISGNGFARATGIETHANVINTVSNSGDIEVTASANDADQGIYGQAFGIYAAGGEVGVSNSGSIDATSTFTAIGIYGYSADGDVSVRNRGTITALSTAGDAVGISGIVSGGDLVLTNTAAGNIAATSVDGDATGMLATLTGANVSITNAGSITATSTNGNAYAIRVVDGSTTLTPGSATIVNSGSIDGAIATGAGADSMTNQRGGTWQVTGAGSDFGAGDDSFTNAAGATVRLSDAWISFGADKNRFTNTGTITVSGHNTIDMTDGSAAAATLALARPKGNASFTNNGIINMLDGAADDSLTITGSFGGNGAINFDVSLANQLNDQLYVAGGVLNGSKQRINVVLLDGLPKSGDVGKELELVHVSGDTNPSVFTGGDVLGISARDFLSMGLTLKATPGTGADGGSYMLKVKTTVKGLSASGVLASSAALGVDSLLSSTAGNWTDRTYSLSNAGNEAALATVVPWVRGFRDEGGMSPDHLSGNFGQMSASRLSQDNFGTEMGLELQARNGFRFGAMVAKSEGKQYLLDERGMDTIRGNTLGLYGSWVSPSGLYVDASWRSMQFEAQMDSIGGRQRSDGNAVAANVETGYTWKLGNGLNIQPQLRYTATSIDGLRIQGDQATFESQDAQWKRGSVGFSLSNNFDSNSGWRLTPYGELSLVRTFEGVASYSINNDYFGDVMTEGTSALVKLGLGAQKGRFSWNGGVNWMNGAAYDQSVGGQMTLQYAW